jgi:hypothetical protein
MGIAVGLPGTSWNALTKMRASAGAGVGMAYCMRCGVSVTDSAEYCPGCGTRVEAATPSGPKPAEPTDSVVVAAFRRNSPYANQRLLYESEHFVIEDSGRVDVRHLFTFDQRAELEWTSDEMRTWAWERSLDATEDSRDRKSDSRGGGPALAITSLAVALLMLGFVLFAPFGEYQYWKDEPTIDGWERHWYTGTYHVDEDPETALIGVGSAVLVGLSAVRLARRQSYGIVMWVCVTGLVAAVVVEILALGWIGWLVGEDGEPGAGLIAAALGSALLWFSQLAEVIRIRRVRTASRGGRVDVIGGARHFRGE